MISELVYNDRLDKLRIDSFLNFLKVVCICRFNVKEERVFGVLFWVKFDKYVKILMVR